MGKTNGNALIFILVALCAINVFGSIGDFGFPESSDEDKTKQNAEVRGLPQLVTFNLLIFAVLF